MKKKHELAALRKEREMLNQRLQVAERFCRFMKERDNFMVNAGVQFLKNEIEKTVQIKGIRDYCQRRAQDFEYIASVEDAFITLASRIMLEEAMRSLLPGLGDALEEMKQRRKKTGLKPPTEIEKMLMNIQAAAQPLIGSFYVGRKID